MKTNKKKKPGAVPVEMNLRAMFSSQIALSFQIQLSYTDVKHFKEENGAEVSALGSSLIGLVFSWHQERKLTGDDDDDDDDDEPL